MIITWYGDMCFKIKNKDTSILINPSKETVKSPIKADIVLLSRERNGEELGKVEGEPKIFDWPGEYEVNDIPIISLQGWDKSLTKEGEGEKGNPVNIFRFSVDEIQFCHLGEIGHTLKSDMMELIGDVDVLFVPASEKGALSAEKAHEIVEQIDPRIVIPMGHGDFKEFLKETGGQTRTEETLTIDPKIKFQEDKTEVVLLKKSE